MPAVTLPQPLPIKNKTMNKDDNNKDFEWLLSQCEMIEHSYKFGLGKVKEPDQCRAVMGRIVITDSPNKPTVSRSHDGTIHTVNIGEMEFDTLRPLFKVSDGKLINTTFFEPVERSFILYLDGTTETAELFEILSISETHFELEIKETAEGPKFQVSSRDLEYGKPEYKNPRPFQMTCGKL